MSKQDSHLDMALLETTLQRTSKRSPVGGEIVGTYLDLIEVALIKVEGV